jgi:fucose 4-O-acetylase-like acetyltransferase
MPALGTARHAAVTPATGSPAGTRAVGVDLVRILGVGAIVAGHNWLDRDWVGPWLFSWHVPVFFVISGFLWKSGRSTRTELRRRARSLLVPYVAWLVVVTAAWYALNAAHGTSVDPGLPHDVLMGGWYTSRPYSAYWFLTALFVATVLARLLQNVHPALVWAVGALGVLWCALDPVTVREVPEAAGLALPAIAFLCIGMALHRVRSFLDRRGAVVAGAVLLAAGLWLPTSGTVDAANMKAGDLGDPVLAGVLVSAAISCGLLLLADGLDPLVPARLRPAVSAVAACALPVILLHTLVTGAFALYGEPLTKLTFAVALLVPLALALVIRQTPLRRVLL